MKHSRKVCKQIASMLSEYLDQELPSDSCADLLAHLEDCPPCIAFIESLKKTIEFTRMAAHPVEPPPVSEDVRASLLRSYETFRKNRQDPKASRSD